MLNAQFKAMQIQRGKVITVERGSRPRAGRGVLKAMGVVWQHWQGSFRKNDQASKIHGTFTQEYPEEQPKLPEAYRNMPILLFDDASGQELCTSCFQCQRICPPQVIHMTQSKDPITGKALPAVAEFIIEYDACMSCGFCAEICPFDAIKMDHVFELATDVHSGLTVHKEQLNRPVSYYERIAPRLWAAVQEGANKKLLGNIKRRSGLIGVAPQMAERVKALRQAAGVVEPAPSPPPPAAAPDASAAPVEAKKLSTEEKAARLAAIRAKNASPENQATGGQVQENTALVSAAAQEAPTAPVKPMAPAAEPGDKAAKLAAIRAANQAAAPTPRSEVAGANPAAEAATAVPAAPAPSENPSVTPEAAPGAVSDEKAARLAAIRAANAARQAAQERGEQ